MILGGSKTKLSSDRFLLQTMNGESLRAMIPGVSKPSSQVIVVMLTGLLERFDPE
jgi:hypothetical protein